MSSSSSQRQTNERQRERQGEGNRRRKRRTRKRKSIQGFIVAEHIMPGKMSAVQPKETLLKVETKALGQTENQYRMRPYFAVVCCHNFNIFDHSILYVESFTYHKEFVCVLYTKANIFYTAQVVASVKDISVYIRVLKITITFYVC